MTEEVFFPGAARGVQGPAPPPWPAGWGPLTWGVAPRPLRPRGRLEGRVAPAGTTVRWASFLNANTQPSVPITFPAFPRDGKF